MVCIKINNCCIFHGTATKKSHTRYNWMVYFMYIINTLLIQMLNVQHPLPRAIFPRNQQKSTDWLPHHHSISDITDFDTCFAFSAPLSLFSCTLLYNVLCTPLSLLFVNTMENQQKIIILYVRVFTTGVEQQPYYNYKNTHTHVG